MQCNLFEDVGLIALDDLDWYPLVGSGITALAQPTTEIGASAFECLLKRLRGDDGAGADAGFCGAIDCQGVHPWEFQVTGLPPSLACQR